MIPAFGAPLMMWGALLVAVPIVIHILNRRRFVVRDFAAIRFLRQAFEERRKRLRLESLLLLLLRCLLVLVAALAMALPFVTSDNPLALVSSGPRDIVLLIDRSGSMGRQTTPGASLDDRVLDAARARIRRLSDERGDGVTVVIMGSATTLAAPIGSPPSVALQALEEDLPPPGGVADVVAAVRFVAERVRPLRPGRIDLEVFTDMQTLTWGSLSASFGELLATILDRGNGRMRLVPFGDDEALRTPVNLGVESLSADQPLALAGEPLGFTAVIRNHGASARMAVEGGFYLDGELRQRVSLEVPPDRPVPVTMRLRIDSPGAHHISFALEGDDLPFDDKRSLALDVRPAVSVLIVDGLPAGGDPLESGSGFLALALDPGNLTAGVRFRTEVRPLSVFEQSASDLAGFDAIALTNVGGMTEAAADALVEAARSGTPLLWFLGSEVEPALYNESLHARGLIPARIGALQGDPGGRGGEDYVTLVLSEPAPRPLALFGDPRLAVLLQVPVLAWRELIPDEGAEVLASFASALGKTTPAIVEGALERGRIVLVATSADDSWSLLPRFPATWVPLIHELLSDLTAPDPAATNVPVGQSPSLTVEGVPQRVQLTLPSGAMHEIARPEYERAGSRSLLSLDATPLVEAGAYDLDIDTAQGRQTLALAALPEAREGDLDRIDVGALDPLLTGIDFVIGEADDEDADLGREAGDGGLAIALLWTLLVLLVSESLLARWMGKGR